MKSTRWSALRATALVIGMTLFNLGATDAYAQISPDQTFPALGAPDDPKVRVSWDHFYDVAGLTQILRQLEAAYPDLCEFIVLGRSVEGREIVGLRVTNEKKGDPRTKPTMYIDGNIHGNEVQTGETVAYTAWYLLEMYGRVERVTRLVDDKAFFLIPTINPDGRDHWFHGAANPHNFRGGMIPIDEDGDGLFDEDGPDDMDGDGHLTRMRVRDPWGRYGPDPDFPEYLMIEVDRDERGEYRLLGQEGFDNDGDGLINEDDPGGYDANRNWPWMWQPEGIQGGAHAYPFSLPETRAIGEFVEAHPNIAAAQTYHNSGGMILRSPGAEVGKMNDRDDDLYAFIGKRGEEFLPGYRSMVLWKDLYQVWGGEIDWFYGAIGVVCFSNELWTEKNLYRKDLEGGDEGRRQRAAFLRYLLQDDGMTAWHEIDHPDYGKVEVGGTAKEFGRVPPSFLLEEELHRNMSFSLYHAESMPLVAIEEVQVSVLGNGLHRVRVGIENHGIIPTRLKHDIDNGITAKNSVTLSGLDVLAAGEVTDPGRDQVAWQDGRPDRLLLETIPGLSRIWVEFLVSGSGSGRVRVEALRGGVAERAFSVPG